ncbi:hypothetical protein [Nannocystis sp. SCPEA4]|uniref:hypothetical protein n=1 Tax=Nannocystis sp. SCPEA4 TaxID=2996787 RepID=UPI002270AE79|nr:hypothetical protein [Nannocystis sp. SCPEA4]MCY1062834.1 hypothetical protein [Nannocystis sp. SCPEA4]
MAAMEATRSNGRILAARILAGVAATGAIAVFPLWHDVFDTGRFNLNPLFAAMVVHGGAAATSNTSGGHRLVETCTGLEHLGPWPLGLLLVTAALACFGAGASCGRTARLSAAAACVAALAAAVVVFNRTLLSHLFYDVVSVGIAEPLFWCMQAIMVPTALALGVCTILEWWSVRRTRGDHTDTAYRLVRRDREASSSVASASKRGSRRTGTRPRRSPAMATRSDERPGHRDHPERREEA